MDGARVRGPVSPVADTLLAGGQQDPQLMPTSVKLSLALSAVTAQLNKEADREKRSQGHEAGKA